MRKCILWAVGIATCAAAPGFAGLTMVQDPDASSWSGTPVIATMPNPQSATVEVEMSATGAVAHTFVAPSNFQLDKFTIRVAGAPTTGMLYLYPSPVGGGPTDGFVNVGFSTSLLNGGAGLPFTFFGTGSRALLTFDLTGADEIFLSSGTKYAIDLVGSTGGSMYWMRGGEVYTPGNIYNRNPVAAPPNQGERFAVAGGTRDGALAIYNVPEPGSLSVIGLAAVGLLARRRNV